MGFILFFFGSHFGNHAVTSFLFNQFLAQSLVFYISMLACFSFTLNSLLFNRKKRFFKINAKKYKERREKYSLNVIDYSERKNIKIYDQKRT